MSGRSSGSRRGFDHDIDQPLVRQVVWGQEGVEGSRKELLQLLHTNAVLHGEFVLASGKPSTTYLDARRVTLSGRGASLVGEVVLASLGMPRPDLVAGMSLGADPIVAAVAVASDSIPPTIDGVLVRKASKQHGTGRLLEGPWESGQTCVVLEDTSTTGSSALQAVSALRSEGVQVEKVISLVDREEGAAQRISAAGLAFQAIFTLTEILQAE